MYQTNNKTRSKYFLLFLFAISIVLADPCQIAFANGDRGASRVDWKLRDIDRREHVLFADSQTAATILVFVSTDCPIANGYQPTLKKLSQQFSSPDFRWLMIHVNSGLKADEARQHAIEYGIDLPVVIDTNHEIIRRVGATRIPEVFVFAKGSERPIYQGRIDNLHVEFGKKRVAPTSHDLKNALIAVRDHTSVLHSQTEVVGCSIAIQDKITLESESAGSRQSQQQDSSTPNYDPLKVSKDKIETQLLSVDDSNRSREIPIRVYLPQQTGAAPVILFSHGLGGSRDNGAYLGNHWAARGYVAVFMQHVGSDESVWKGQRPREILTKMREAADGKNFSLRVKDVPAVIDQLEKWNKESGHPLYGRLDLERIGMTGHSFGAVTTQAVSGQRFLGRAQFTEARIKAALPMSPSVPRAGSAEKSFGAVTIPWLLMTGTEDTSIINDTTVENRLSVYPALPEGSKYELVLHDGTHAAFSERALPGDRGKRNPNHHRAIMALSTAFWDAYLKEDSAARTWLDGEAVRNVLEEKDRWQKK